MSREAETAVRALLERLDTTGWDADQIDRIVEAMTPDARYHVLAWEAPHVGRDAIRAELMRQASIFSDYRSEIVASASAGSVVFVEKLDSMTLAGQTITVHVVAVYDTVDGKVSSWRDYVDRKEVETKLSVDIVALGSAVGGPPPSEGTSP